MVTQGSVWSRGQSMVIQGSVRSSRAVYGHAGQRMVTQGSVWSRRAVYGQAGQCTVTQGSAWGRGRTYVVTHWQNTNYTKLLILVAGKAQIYPGFY